MATRKCTRCAQRSRSTGYVCAECRADEESTAERILERQSGWGAFESRAQACAALGRSIDRDGGWWGDLKVERWAHYHTLSVVQAEGLISDLEQAGRLLVRTYDGASRQVRSRGQGVAA